MLSGEVILWAGQPLRKVIFHSKDWFAIPFTLGWGGFAIFGEFGASLNTGKAAQSSWFFELWGIPFIVVGQYLIWGRFFYTAWKKGRTFYAVTTKRVLVLNTGRQRKLVSGALGNLIQ